MIKADVNYFKLLGDAVENPNLDEALLPIMKAFGIETGDVAGIVFSDYDWRSMNFWERANALLKWVTVENMFSVIDAEVKAGEEEMNRVRIQLVRKIVDGHWDRKCDRWDNVEATVDYAGLKSLRLPTYQANEIGALTPMHSFSKKPIEWCFFLIVDGRRFLVNTEGFDYCRYVARVWQGN